MILFSRFYSELHSIGTIIVDVNSIAAAAMSDACTVSTAMASRLFVLLRRPKKLSWRLPVKHWIVIAYAVSCCLLQ